MDVTEERTNNLRATSEHPPIVFENHSQDSRYTGPLSVAPTVSRKYGTGGNNQPLVLGDESRLVAAVDVRLTTENSKLVRHNVYETEVSRCLSADGARPDANQGGLAIVERSSYAVTTGTYTQVEREKSPTLMARDYKFPHAVCRGIGRDAFNQGQNAKFGITIEENKQPTILAKGAGAVACVGNGQLHQAQLQEKSGALNCMHDQQCAMVKNWVRRYTPRECERLQGLPDDFTLIPDKTCSDAARYKALGNGMAQPCADFIIKRIAQIMRMEAAGGGDKM